MEATHVRQGGEALYHRRRNQMAIYYHPCTLARWFLWTIDWISEMLIVIAKNIGQKRLTLEQLITILAEVEGIVNTCPLT